MIKAEEYQKSYTSLKKLIAKKEFYQKTQNQDLKAFEIFIQQSKMLLKDTSITKSSVSTLASSYLVELSNLFEKFKTQSSIDRNASVSFVSKDSVMLETWLKVAIKIIYNALNPSGIAIKQREKRNKETKELLVEATKDKLPEKIDAINAILGNKFIEKYIKTKKADWIVYAEEKNCMAAKLVGMRLKDENDCVWFRNKLLKANIKAEDIHFDPINDTKIGMSYQMRIINIQNISSLNKAESLNDTLLNLTLK